VQLGGVYKKLGKRQFEIREKQKQGIEGSELGPAAREAMSTSDILQRIVKHRRRPQGFNSLQGQIQRLQTEPEAVKQLAKDLYGLEQRMQEMIAEVCSIAAAQGPQAG
jgi:hypothetical protein